MFENDMTITGKHATYVKYLCNDLKVFERYIDAFFAGAIVGVFNKKLSTKDSSSDRARIYADTVSNENRKCFEIFRTVVLYDESKKWDIDEKLNICFRYRDKQDDTVFPPITEKEVDKMAEAYNLFMSYFYGGIEILFQELNSKNSKSMDDVIDIEYDLAKRYKVLLDSVNNDDLDSTLFEEQF